MKKIIGIILVFILGGLLFILTGCGKNVETGNLNNNISTQDINTKNTATVKDIVKNAENYYGKVVTNYKPSENADPNVEWKLFLADEEEDKIYLIASDYVSYQYIPQYGLKTGDSDYDIEFDEFYTEGGSDVIIKNFDNDTLSKWHKWINANRTSSGINIKEISLLLDKDNWNMYKDSIFADYAIGGPTIEMFVQSYNSTHTQNPNNYIEYDFTKSEHGYMIKAKENNDFSTEYINLDKNDELYTKLNYDTARIMWLASPSASGISLQHDLANNQIMMVSSGGAITHNKGDNSFVTGLRPIISLKSGLKIEKDGEGYKIVE